MTWQEVMCGAVLHRGLQSVLRGCVAKQQVPPLRYSACSESNRDRLERFFKYEYEAINYLACVDPRRGFRVGFRLRAGVGSICHTFAPYSGSQRTSDSV